MENNEISAVNEQQDLLSAESLALEQFVYATQGQRFLNWLIDNLLMQYGLSYLTGMAIGFLIAIISPDFFDNINGTGGISGSLLLVTFLTVSYEIWKSVRANPVVALRTE